MIYAVYICIGPTSNNRNMISLHPQYIIDTAGEQLVVITLKEFESILEELDQIEDIHLFDEAKKNDDGIRISVKDFLENRGKSIS